MNKTPAWKEKAWKAKCHEGYAEVSYEDVWSLDTRLARIIANHLRAFLKAEKGPYGGHTFGKDYRQPSSGFLEGRKRAIRRYTGQHH